MKKIMIFLIYIFLSPANAAPIGDDGLHKPDWLRFTFNDMVEDFDEARLLPSSKDLESLI